MEREGGFAVYDVLYVNGKRSGILAAGIDREAAISIARAEARKRRAGRMFAAGSSAATAGNLVLIVDSRDTARRG
jgi:hypothetical protein